MHPTLSKTDSDPWVPCFEMLNPYMTLFDDFLSESECEYLTKTYGPKTRPIGFVGDDGNEVFSNQRTSTGCSLGDFSDSIVDKIEARIERASAWPQLKTEPLSFVHYAQGQEIKKHHDFLDGSIHPTKQRIATALLYLNDTDDSGKTYFPRLNTTIYPKKGRILLFSYPKADNKSLLLHQSPPLRKGDKFILVKWFRTDFVV